MITIRSMRLTEANYSNGDYYHYSHDTAGNRQREETKVGGDTTVEFYQYDAANRLIALSNQQSAFSYSNNGLGDRLQQIANGQTTDYTLDL